MAIESTADMNSSLIACEGLGRDINRRVVLSDVSFRIEAGARLALIGPNGVGKTTLIRTLLGVLRPTRGSVRVWGLDPWDHGPAVRVRCGVMTENCSMTPSATVLENLVVWGRWFGLSPAEARAAAVGELEAFGMSEQIGSVAGALSAGQRRRVGLARAFMTDPELVVLDEPTAGLDLTARRALRARLLSERAGRPLTAIIASHEVSEVEKVATHLMTIGAGRVIEFGPLQQVLDGRSLDEHVEALFAPVG